VDRAPGDLGVDRRGLRDRVVLGRGRRRVVVVIVVFLVVVIVVFLVVVIVILLVVVIVVFLVVVVVVVFLVVVVFAVHPGGSVAIIHAEADQGDEDVSLVGNDDNRSNGLLVRKVHAPCSVVARSGDRDNVDHRLGALGRQEDQLRRAAHHGSDENGAAEDVLVGVDLHRCAGQHHERRGRAGSATPFGHSRGAKGAARDEEGCATCVALAAIVAEVDVAVTTESSDAEESQHGQARKPRGHRK
jgi:hypothetical protein